jgi:uncharacterized protein YcbX
MTVSSIRRYPVKSMGGEALDEVLLDARGIVGDRWYAVQDDEGHFASGKSTRRFRRYDAVFGYAAATGSDGVVVTGARGRWRVGDPALDRELTRALGVPARITSEADVSHFDDGAVSLIGTATLRWCAQRWGIRADPKRLRANLVVRTDEPFVEERWVAQELSVGEARLRVVDSHVRCRTVDVAQDWASVEGRWLAPLARERELRLGVYADVVTAGLLRAGDRVAP